MTKAPTPDIWSGGVVHKDCSKTGLFNAVLTNLETEEIVYLVYGSEDPDQVVLLLAFAAGYAEAINNMVKAGRMASTATDLMKKAGLKI